MNCIRLKCRKVKRILHTKHLRRNVSSTEINNMSKSNCGKCWKALHVINNMRGLRASGDLNAVNSRFTFIFVRLWRARGARTAYKIRTYVPNAACRSLAAKWNNMHNLFDSFFLFHFWICSFTQNVNARIARAHDNTNITDGINTQCPCPIVHTFHSHSIIFLLSSSFAVNKRNRVAHDGRTQAAIN